MFVTDEDAGMLAREVQVNFDSCLPVASCLLFINGYLENITIASLRCMTDQWSRCRTTRTASMKRGLRTANISGGNHMSLYRNVRPSIDFPSRYHVHTGKLVLYVGPRPTSESNLLFLHEVA